MRYTLVIYDITDDNLRNEIAQICMDNGLVRIQKSAFLGVIDSQRRKHLIHLLRRKLGSNKGNIQVFVICEDDMRYRTIISNEEVPREAGDTIII